MAKELAIYMATHNKKCSHIIEQDYIIPIQVGKALNKKVIENVTDDIGDNISNKNPIYCELTALYWMWKNSNAENIGLCHYRRWFDIDKEEILKLLDFDNVIIPKKKLFRMSLKDQYIKEHRESDWDILINTLKDIYPEYYMFSKKVFNSNIIYPFNMFIMSKKKFDDYCEWIFPLLLSIEKKIKNNSLEEYQNRYIGFMAERLFTLYILYNNFNLYESSIIFENDLVKLETIKNIFNNIIFKYKELVNVIRRK